MYRSGHCRSRKRSAGNELAPGKVHAEVEALEALRPEHDHVTRAGKGHNARRESSRHIDERESDRAFNYLTIGCLEPVHPDGNDAQLCQDRLRRPTVLASRVDDDRVSV